MPSPATVLPLILLVLSMNGKAGPAMVSGRWLAAHLGEPHIVLLDARASLRDVLKEHIPGAQPLSGENIRAAAGGVPGEIYPPEVIATIAARLGIGPATHVVVYGAATDPDATLVASALRMSGFAGVSVLDGGLTRWKAEGRPVSGERKLTPAAARPLPARGMLDGLATLEDVRAAVKDRSAVIIDARPPEQYEAGRIAGAVNRPWKNDVVGEEGKEGPAQGSLLPVEELRKDYAALGVIAGTPAIVYCNTGHMASEVFFTLRYVLGLDNIRLYDGSWTEWSIAPDTPSESGPARPPSQP